MNLHRRADVRPYTCVIQFFDVACLSRYIKSVLDTDYTFPPFSHRLKRLVTPETGDYKFGPLTVDCKITTVTVDYVL